MTRILLVEDEPDLADPLAYLLRREGYEVEICEDGPGALTAFREEVERALDLVAGRCGLGILIETQDAVARADELGAQSHADAARMRAEVDEYVDTRLADFGTTLERMLRSVEKARLNLREP